MEERFAILRDRLFLKDRAGILTAGFPIAPEFLEQENFSLALSQLSLSIARHPSIPVSFIVRSSSDPIRSKASVNRMNQSIHQSFSLIF
jgi:hypothetical protein